MINIRVVYYKCFVLLREMNGSPTPMENPVFVPR